VTAALCCAWCLVCAGPAVSSAGTGHASQPARDAAVATRAPTVSEAAALAAAMARYGFPASKWRLAHTAVSVHPSGYAIATPIARNPADQGNGVVVFAETHGRWRAVAQGSAIRRAPGVPSSVLRVLLRVPGEGSAASLSP